MKNLYNDSKDVIEKKWAVLVSKHFPMYVAFWNEFIGIRETNHNTALLPYKYKLPTNWNSSQKQAFGLILEELFMSHYSLFCNLAGAHFQLEKCIESLSLTKTDDMHFEYWEAFECSYQHMGNAINYFYFFWDRLFTLTDQPIKRNNNDVNKTAVLNALEVLLKQNRKTSLYKQLEREFRRKGQIEIVRNNIVHYSRLASRSFGRKGYSLPYKLKDNVRWSQRSHSKYGILAHKKAENYLTLLETILNSTEEIAVSYLREYLQTKKIIIDY